VSERLARARAAQVARTLRAPRRGPVLQVVKSAVATIAAWLISSWLIQGPPPVFAAIAALLVVQPSLNQSLAKAVERSVGVIGGVVIASLLGLAFGADTWVVLLATVVALVVAWSLRMSPGTTNQFAISAVLVLALGTTTPDYAADRVLETLIGAALGILANLLLVAPVALAPARERVDALADEIAAALDRLALALETPQTPEALRELLLTARLMRPMVVKAEEAIADGVDSLTLNPRSRRHRDDLARLQRRMDVYSPIVTQVIGMTRACAERYVPSIGDEPSVRAIAEQLRRAAHDVRLGADPVDRNDPVGVGEPPALTTPLQVRSPSPEHWVLVGSLLVDLHRIHENLGESTGGDA
jgi:uncharacterized membrane protein YccC